MRKIFCIIKKELIQIRRDKPMMALLFLVPLVQLILLGYAVSTEVKHVRTVVCDLDNTPLSRALIERLMHSGSIDIRYKEFQENRIGDYLETGKASLALVIPHNFAQLLNNSLPTQLQILVDGQDSNTATIAFGYMQDLLQEFMQEQLAQFSMRLPESACFRWVNPKIRVWYNPELKTSDYMVPCIVVFLLTIITSLISAMGLVREKEIGTLEQLLVSPLKKHMILIGKIIPFSGVGLIELFLGILFAKIWYDIPLVGNLGLFTLFILIYLFTCLGIGLFVSASVDTQQQAMFFTFFFIFFFMVMSGFIFPIANMPKSIQILTYLNPMRYMVTVTRELFIKGSGVSHLFPQGIALLVFSTTIFSFAVWRFQKRMK